MKRRHRAVAMAIAVSVLAACGEPTGPDYATLVITTTSLPNAVPTVSYSETLVATGGDSIYTWSVTDGSLPTGLSLTASTGVISGTPGAEGGDTFTVQVVSGDGQTDTQQLAITVEVPVLQPGELCSDYPNVAIATFEDAGLSAAIRTALSVSAPEDLTCGLISGLTGLDARYGGIGSLVGIQNLTGLTSVSLTFNPISDISALSGLTNLTELVLGQNSISDISPLRGLTNLTVLVLFGNSISDVTPLSGLTSLTGLYLSENAISDISALGDLTSLSELDLLDNSISDIGVLSGLTSLTLLTLSDNPIGDYSTLSGLTSLIFLHLSDNAISDISPLSGLTSLTYLILNNNSISDISVLSGLTSLERLELNNNSISDIGALSGLTKLVRLDLRYNHTLTDIQPLLDNTGLGDDERVYLNGTGVSCADVAALRAKGVRVGSDCP